MGLMLWLATPRPAAGAPEGKEVWLSPAKSALGTGKFAGTGSRASPLQGDFDAIINSLPAGSTLHLLPGVFYTKGFQWLPGDAALKADQKIIGAGMDVTIVRRDPHFHGDTGQIDGLLWSRANGVEISDLTVDADAGETVKFKKAAIHLSGSFCAVRRVKAIHTAGNWARGQECFPIWLGWTNTVGNVISECEVSRVRGSYCTAITLAGRGTVKFNRVFFPALDRNQPGFTGYQADGSRDALFFDNFCQGGSSGFHTDTFSETNLTFLDNCFRDVVYGFTLIKSGDWNVDGATFRNNVIELNPKVAGSAIIVRNQKRNAKVLYQNVAIAGNTIRGAGAPPHPGSVALEIDSPTGDNFRNVRILDNTMDRSLRFVLRASGVLLAHNTDLAGVPLDVRHLDGRESPEAVSLGPLDGKVFVSADHTREIILPPARGFPGKTVMIANEKPFGALLVKTARPDKLLPSDTVRVWPGRTATFISDGSEKWLRE